MGRTAWMKLIVAGAGMVLAFTAVACSNDGDDEGSQSGGNPSPTAVTDNATLTPGPQGAPIIDSTGGNTGGPGGNSGSAPPLPPFEQPPPTTASANRQTVDTGIGTYCWTTMCVDKIGVPTRGALTVHRGDTVTVVVPEEVPALREAGVTVFEATQPQRLDDGSDIWPYPGSPGEQVASRVSGETVEVTVDLAPGRYVLSVGMYFEAGDVIYGVLLEVQ